MRTRSAPSSRLARALVFASALVLAAGCGGGGSGSAPIPNPGSSAYCDNMSPGSVLLAQPPQGSTGVSTGINTIEVVSSTNSDQLNASFGMFDVNLIDNFGNGVVTNFLGRSSDPQGYHPFANDFYYSATLQGGLLPGRTYSAYLNAPNTNCTFLPIGQFST